MADMDVRELQRRGRIDYRISGFLPERRVRFEFLDVLIHRLRFGIEKFGDRVRETLIRDPVRGDRKSVV